jgi:hypothetical protein
VAILDTLVDVDVEDLPLNDGLLTIAALAAVTLADSLTLTITVWANSLETLNHRSHLAHHSLHTRAIAAAARLNGAFLATAAITTSADDRLLQRQFRHLSTVDILQVNFVNVVDGAGLLGTLFPHATAEHTAESATTAKELGEEILCTHSTSTTTIFKTLLAELVVDGTLLRVGKDFVSTGKFLEFFGGFWVVCVLV